MPHVIGNAAGKQIRIWLFAVYRILMNIVASALWHCGPQRTHQIRAFAFARSLAPVLKFAFGGRSPSSPSYEAQIFNSLITRFSKIHPGLALDIIFSNDSLIELSLQNGQGLLIATVHSQLSLSAHVMCDAQGRPPIFVGNHHDDMTGWNWGRIEPIEALDSEKITVLMNIRSALRSGRIVVSFVDFNDVCTGTLFISPNLFYLAHSTQVPTLYMLCSLESAGRIRVNLSAEPRSFKDAHEKAEAFLEFIRQELGANLRLDRPKRHLA